MKDLHFFHGAMYFFQGCKDLYRKGLKRFIIIPLFINILIFGGLFYFGLAWLWQKLNMLDGNFLPHWLSWFGGVMHTLKIFIMTLVTTISLGAFAILSTLGANLLASPFNGFLSEKLSRNLKFDLPASPSVMKIIRREMKKLFYYLPRALFIALISIILYFIPPLNLLIPFLLYGFGSWMMAIQYVDYPADNFGVTFKDLTKILKANKGVALGFGLIVAFLSSIPLVNFLVMPAAVLGATRLWHDIFEQKH